MTTVSRIQKAVTIWGMTINPSFVRIQILDIQVNCRDVSRRASWPGKSFGGNRPVAGRWVRLWSTVGVRPHAICDARFQGLIAA